MRACLRARKQIVLAIGRADGADRTLSWHDVCPTTSLFPLFSLSLALIYHELLITSFTTLGVPRNSEHLRVCDLSPFRCRRDRFAVIFDVAFPSCKRTVGDADPAGDNTRYALRRMAIPLKLVRFDSVILL